MELWMGRLHGFPIGIFTGRVCTSFIGESLGIKYTFIAWRKTAGDDIALHDCGLLIGYKCMHNISAGFILAAGSPRLPFLMRSRPEQRLSRVWVWPQCMIVSQRAPRIAQEDKYGESSMHTPCTESTARVLCMHLPRIYSENWKRTTKSKT